MTSTKNESRDSTQKALDDIVEDAFTGVGGVRGDAIGRVLVRSAIDKALTLVLRGESGEENLLDRILTVDVKLEPATYIRAGCTIHTVVVGLSADYRSRPALTAGTAEQEKEVRQEAATKTSEKMQICPKCGWQLVDPAAEMLPCQDQDCGAAT